MNVLEHSFRRQIVDVSMQGTESEAIAVQRRVGELCYAMLNRLDPMLNRIVPRDEYWLVERLDVDLGAIPFKDLDENFAAAFAIAFEEQLREHCRSAEFQSMPRRSDAHRVHEAFVFFLRSGALPWWFRLPIGTTLEQRVLDSWSANTDAVQVSQYHRQEIIEALADSASRLRLLRQFSPTFQKMLLSRIAPAWADESRKVLQAIDASSLSSVLRAALSAQIIVAAFEYTALGRSPMDELIDVCRRFATSFSGETQDTNALQELLVTLRPARQASRHPLIEGAARLGASTPQSQSTLDISGTKLLQPVKTIEPSVANRANTQIDLKEGIYVACAGVVLLHPYLEPFLKAVGVAAEDRLIDPERAVLLLHYLATGQCVVPEQETVLQKLLCGVAAQTPIESSFEPTAQEKEEAEALLLAVIRHWEALGSTSIEGLRGTFLVRPGKLSQREDGDYLLQVEGSSVDILLERLPWGLSAIKLPWMQRILWVEWIRG